MLNVSNLVPLLYSKKSNGSNPVVTDGPSVWSLNVLPMWVWVFSRFSSVLAHSDLEIRFVGYHMTYT